MTAIPVETLGAVAKQAAGEFLASGTDLSTAVIKAASLLGAQLTDEHVRRICEMALHEAFEGAYHAKAGSADRYVSFDPPDPVFCAAELKALPIHVAPQVPRGPAESPVSVLKAASAPRQKYVARDPIALLFPVSAEKVAEAWENPLRELLDIREMHKEATRHLAGELSLAKTSGHEAMVALAAQADQACKEGASIGLVLHACAAGMSDTLLPGEATEVLRDLGAHLVQRGYDASDTKLAENMVPNPDHPLACMFFKAASLRSQRAHLEIALSEATIEFNKVEREVAALCH